MGIGGISIWQLLIILVIVLLLFGTKRLRTLGTDLGNAIKGFRGAMRDGEEGKDEAAVKDNKLEGPGEQPARGAEDEAASKEKNKI